MATNRSSRRRFLQTSAAASAALALPYYVPARAFGASDRLITGAIGVRNRGGETQNLKDFRKNCVAVCDVDQAVAANAAKFVTEGATNATSTTTIAACSTARTLTQWSFRRPTIGMP